MRAIYLTPENSIHRFDEREEKHFPEIIDTTAIVSPKFFYYSTWLDGVKGGFKENFDDLDLAEDGEGEERERIESLRRGFFTNFVQVELHVSEELFNTLKNQGADHVICRPITCYVLNVWGNARLSMADLFRKPEEALKEIQW
jgi:hypothetical protein